MSKTPSRECAFPTGGIVLHKCLHTSTHVRPRGDVPTQPSRPCQAKALKRPLSMHRCTWLHMCTWLMAPVPCCAFGYSFINLT